MSRIAVIAGGGPAGLTAASELQQKTDIHPIILEESQALGGISRTINHNGNRMDIGGHRFFSKNDTVMNWWLKKMPVQGSPAMDDVLLGRKKPLSDGGPDPEKDDRVMLVRDRVSRIFFLRHFFDYPISMKGSTFKGMGLGRTLKAGFGYIRARLFPLKEDSLENFYINRFGRPLYEMFFEDYTEKVWGVHPSKIGADWGAQRVKGLSISALLKDIITRPFRSRSIEQKKVETSLIEQFIYPKYGPGQLWETVGADILAAGGEILLGHKLTRINVEGGKVVSVQAECDGIVKTFPCDYFLSSMPIKDLVAAINGVQPPEDVIRIADGLPYRDFITVGLLVSKLLINNDTRTPTFEGRIPDTWIYIQERDVRVGRLQIFNNWSPYMAADYKNSIFIGLEYFCKEGDEMWEMPDDEFIKMAIGEMKSIGVVDPADVLDATRAKVRKAYPAYFGTYKEFDTVRTWLDTIPNLFCIGRNGQHRYNTMDHSMLTAMEAVNCIAAGSTDKTPVWNVNTEKEYHESK